MEERQHSDNSFLTGLVLGGIIGAGLALVFSKDEGEEVRKVLTKKGKTLLKNLGEIIGEERADLKEHWGEEKEKEEKKEKKEKKEEQISTVKKVAQKFFHRNGKTLR